MAAAFGIAPKSWGVLDDAGALDRAPAAGWNVCHRADKQHGHFDTVCLFDGDVDIGGLPYRTAELDVDGSLFGGDKVLDLLRGIE